MRDFRYEIFIMRFAFLVGALAFIGVLLYAFLLEISRNDQAANMAFQESVVADLGQDGIQSLPLDQPHRTNKEIQGWVNQVVSESLSFDRAGYDGVKEAIQPYFTAAGIQQYEGFIRQSGMLNSLEINNYRMSIFLENSPLQLSSSKINDVYRWLYQVPVTISFLPRGLNDLTNQREEIVNRKINLRVQITRVSNDESPDEMQIESWNATTRR